MEVFTVSTTVAKDGMEERKIENVRYKNNRTASCKSSSEEYKLFQLQLLFIALLLYYSYTSLLQSLINELVLLQLAPASPTSISIYQRADDVA